MQKAAFPHHSPAHSGLVAWFIGYLKENPLKVLSFFTFSLGVALLAPVFLEIGELPQLDLPSTLPLFAVITLGGLASMILIAGLPIFGALLARSTSESPPAWQVDGWAVLVYLVPGVGVSLLLWASLHMGLSAGGFATHLLLGLMALGPLLAGLRIWRLRPRLADLPSAIEAWGTLAMGSFFQTALIFYLVYASIVLTIPQSKTLHELDVCLLAWTLYAAVVTISVTRVKSMRLIRTLLCLAFAASIVLFLATGEMTAISKALLGKIGWGNYVAKVFVSDRGCALLNQSLGRTVCKIGASAGGNLVCPVIVRSRIGTPNFLAFSPFTPTGNWPDRDEETNASLPKEDVIVTQRISALADSKVLDHATSSRGPVTFLGEYSTAQRTWVEAQCAQ